MHCKYWNTKVQVDHHVLRIHLPIDDPCFWVSMGYANDKPVKGDRPDLDLNLGFFLKGCLNKKKQQLKYIKYKISRFNCQYIDIHELVKILYICVVLRACCLEGSGPTRWGRRMLPLTGFCAPGCLVWARLSYWMWVGSSSTLMEPSSSRTCLTSFTWHQQVTAPWPSPSATCCFRYWTRRQRRGGRHWFEGRGWTAH